MSFKDRFKGRTSLISKEGIESVVVSPKNPVLTAKSFEQAVNIPLMNGKEVLQSKI